MLNSLAGELLQASVRCLREHGRFLEIGKADLSNNTGLGRCGITSCKERGILCAASVIKEIVYNYYML